MKPPLPLYVEPSSSVDAGADSVAAQAFVFRHEGRLHVTIMARVGLELLQDRAMRIMPVAPSFRSAGTFEPNGAPTASTDARPLLRRADVTYVGHAQAPGQNPTRRLLVRFALVRPATPGGPLEGGVPLFDKSLGVIGQRFATAREPNPFPGAFIRLPISYALALGGPHDPQNPVGVGREVDQQGILHLPSVVPAGEVHTGPGPLGYGPIPNRWPARARLTLETRSDAITDLPMDLDFELFQSAPFDQRVDLLRGDEWVYLENLHPRFPKLVTRLPCIRGEARVETGNGVVQRLPLRIDALAIFGDDGRAELTCSGAFSVDDESTLGRLAICAAVTAGGEEPRWPVPRASQPELPHRRADFAGTMVLELPAEPERLPSPPPALALLVMSGQTVLVPVEADIELASESLGPESAAPMAIDLAAREADVGPSTQVFSSSFERHRTTVIEPEAPPSTHAPFRLGKPRSRPDADRAPIPGAPWEEAAPPAVRPVTRPGIDEVDEAPPALTLANPMESPAAPAPSAPSVDVPSIRSVPPQSKAPPKKAGADLWAKPDPREAAPAPAPRPKALVPTPGVKKNTLYDRFKKG